MFARLVIIAFLLLTVVYLALWYALRADRKARIEHDWHESPEGALNGFLAERMTVYERRLRRILLATVYGLPTLVMIVTIYLTNFQ